MVKMAAKDEILLINPKSLNKTQMSGLFGVSIQTIADWVKKGCPRYKDTSAKGQPMAYDLGSVIRWRMEWLKTQSKAVSKDDLDTEKLKEQIRKLQLENAEREKKTISREKFEQIQRKQAQEIMNFFTEGYKRNAQLMMKNLGVAANKLVEFLEVWDAFMKEALDKFVESGRDIE